jgi:hypothetical protein
MAVATGRLLLEGTAPQRPYRPRRRPRLAAPLGYGRGYASPAGPRRELGFPGITLAAQLHAVSFYEGLGYVARGEVFLDAGIEHRWMDLAFER